MNTYKILHISDDEKFIEPFINFIENNHQINNHYFIIFNNNSNTYVKERKNLNKISFDYKSAIKLLLKCALSERIILHGLHNKKLVFLLWLMPWVLKRSYWCIWGADLYSFGIKRDTLKLKLDYILRCQIIPKIGHLVSYLPGDILLARQHFHAKGIYHECFLYPSNLYKHVELQKKITTDIGILVGNSATSSNNHLDIFRKLLIHKIKDINIYCPLSYGDSKYGKYIEEEGKTYFGNKFHALLDFMPLKNYLELLSDIDIAIFAHDRQQAMGNIISLLGLGKTIFLKKNTTSWEFLYNLGFFIKTFEDFDLEKITQEEAFHNVMKAKNIFSEETLATQLNNLFDK
jgi:hypothetical protein